MAQTSLDPYEALANAGPAAQKLTEGALAHLGLSPEGLLYVIETGISPPARKVGRKRRRNLIFDVPLKSIPGTVLQAESMTGEFNFLVELDRRCDLLAVFDQPITINIAITDFMLVLGHNYDICHNTYDVSQATVSLLISSRT